CPVLPSADMVGESLRSPAASRCWRPTRAEHACRHRAEYGRGRVARRVLSAVALLALRNALARAESTLYVTGSNAPVSGQLISIKTPELTNAIFTACRPTLPLRPCAPTAASP